MNELPKKLRLNKETIAKLNNNDVYSLQGGVKSGGGDNTVIVSPSAVCSGICQSAVCGSVFCGSLFACGTTICAGSGGGCGGNCITITVN